MITSAALIPSLLNSDSKADNTSLVRSLGACLLGITLLSALAQISIPLPFTPVPITGQTFGVTLFALVYGRRLALATVAGYLALGAAGFPIFSGGIAPAALGPTAGYLVGMLASAYVVGLQADRGATRTLRRTLLAAASGSALVYGFGAAGLAFFVPLKAVFALGVLPFIPGDILKTALACSMARGLDARLNRSRL